jgi:hypothetical protein
MKRKVMEGRKRSEGKYSEGRKGRKVKNIRRGKRRKEGRK